MNTTCAVRGCEKQAALGARLCTEHLEQVQIAHDVVTTPKTSDKTPNPYDMAVADFTMRIANSDQMRNLTAAMIEGGFHNAIDSFPELETIPAGVVEQLASFLAVSVVSAIIQERAHLLTRAAMIAEALPKSESDGIRKFIEIEMEHVEGGMGTM